MAYLIVIFPSHRTLYLGLTNLIGHIFLRFGIHGFKGHKQSHLQIEGMRTLGLPRDPNTP